MFALVAGLIAGACGSPPARNPYAGGHFRPDPPAYLPAGSLSAHDDRVLPGSAAHPALTVEGDAVRVSGAGWSVLVDVAGPVVPGEGLPYQTPYTTCTWTVTLSDASSAVPLSLAQWSSVDHQGRVYHPQLVPGEAPPPGQVRPGETVTFRVRAYEQVGEGLMRWAPDGQHAVAAWDYSVEND